MRISFARQFVFAMIAWTCSLAVAVGSEPLYNPKPDPGDKVLPMPGGLSMVFRKITVPGESFWFDPARIKRLGDPQGDVFSRERSLEVSGTFTEPAADNWWYFLGKYEVTKAQYAAVMGGGDIDAGLAVLAERSADPDDAKLPHLSGKARESALASPVRWMRVSDFEEFIDRYNNWLFDSAHPERLEPVPKLRYSVQGGKRTFPGFVRLPSEIEWEYAARGGMLASADEFSGRVPFAPNQAESHAWLRENARSKVKPVGRREPAFGLYDMIGNVNELTLDNFQPEIGRGKLGGRTVRGGSVLTPATDASSGLRQELTLYQFDNTGSSIEPTRSPVTGIRLALGTLVKPDAQYFSLIEREYEAAVARRSTSSAAPAGGQQAKINLSTEELVETMKDLKRLAGAHPFLEQDVNAMIQRLRRVQQLQDQEIQTITADLVLVAVKDAADFGRDCVRLEDRRRVLPIAEKLKETSAQARKNFYDIQRQMESFEARMHSTALRYKRALERLETYGELYFEKAYENAQNRRNQPKIERAALRLVKEHMPGVRRGNLTVERIEGNLIDNVCIAELR